jgi:hypothetical protein
MKTRFVIAWSGLLLVLARFLMWSSEVMSRPVGYLMKRAILPCPKCGGVGDDYFETGMELMQVIRCVECGYFCEQAWDDLPKAISIWNAAR